MSFSVYILYSPAHNKYYIGSCEDMGIRLEQHNKGRNKSTKFRAPWELKYTASFPTRSMAVAKEKEIKNKKSRKYIEWLISSAG